MASITTILTDDNGRSIRKERALVNPLGTLATTRHAPEQLDAEEARALADGADTVTVTTLVPQVSLLLGEAQGGDADADVVHDAAFTSGYPDGPEVVILGSWNDDFIVEYSTGLDGFEEV